MLSPGGQVEPLCHVENGSLPGKIWFNRDMLKLAQTKGGRFMRREMEIRGPEDKATGASQESRTRNWNFKSSQSFSIPSRVISSLIPAPLTASPQSSLSLSVQTRPCTDHVQTMVPDPAILAWPFCFSTTMKNSSLWVPIPNSWKVALSRRGVYLGKEDRVAEPTLLMQKSWLGDGTGRFIQRDSTPVRQLFLHF